MTLASLQIANNGVKANNLSGRKVSDATADGQVSHTGEILALPSIILRTQKQKHLDFEALIKGSGLHPQVSSVAAPLPGREEYAVAKASLN